MQEKVIIQKVLEGGHEHYAHLVRKYQNLVFLVCMGFVHNEEDANDLTQEIFINAFQKLHSFDGRAKFSTWLYRIAVNAALNAQRKKSRWRFFSLMDGRLEKPAQDDNWILPSEDDDPEQAMINHQERQLIEQAIDGLPEKQRTAFVLSKYDDLPQREIAAIMNTSEGSVEQLLLRAKANLQKKLVPFYKKSDGAHRKMDANGSNKQNTTTMTCKECTYNMDRYLAQTLSGEALNVMAQHLAHCRQCQQQLLVLERINQMVALDRKSTPSGYTEARVMGAIEAMNNRGQSGVVIRMRRALLVASVAASMGAGIMLGSLVQHDGDNGYYAEELTYLNDLEMEGFQKLITE